MSQPSPVSTLLLENSGKIVSIAAYLTKLGNAR